MKKLNDLIKSIIIGVTATYGITEAKDLDASQNMDELEDGGKIIEQLPQKPQLVFRQATDSDDLYLTQHTSHKSHSSHRSHRSHSSHRSHWSSSSV